MTADSLAGYSEIGRIGLFVETKPVPQPFSQNRCPMEVELSKDQKITVMMTFSVAPIMQQILLRENQVSRASEHFWIVGLNNANQILFVELVALGAGNMLKVTPREGFRMAIYKLAIKVILVHSHPSGVVTPSKADKDFTEYFYEAGRFLNIEVLDHLIISEEDFYSFSDAGLMRILRENKRFMVPQELKAEAKYEGKLEGIVLGKKEGVKQGERLAQEKHKEQLKHVKELERQKKKEAVQAAKAEERKKKAEALEAERKKKAEAVQSAKDAERKKQLESIRTIARNSLKGE